MLATRRQRPGVMRGSRRLRLLLARRGGRFDRLLDQRLALGGLKRLVFRPLLAQAASVLRRMLLRDGAVVLARLAALLRRELGPVLHAPLHARLAFRLHLRIALRDAEPLLLALGLEGVPVLLERREDLLLVGGKLRPGRAGRGRFLRRL